MTILHLLDNTVGPPGVTGGFTVTFELGRKWSTSTTGAIIGLRWLATNTNTADKPTALRLWDVAAARVVAQITGVPHSGIAEWQDAALGVPFVPTTGHDYLVSMGLPTGAHLAALGSVTSAPSPLSFTGSVGVQTGDNGIGTLPTSASSTNWYVDIIFDTDPAGTFPPPATPADLQNALADWLSVSDQTHGSDSAPAHTEALATGATGFDAIKAVADAVAAAVSGLPGTIASAVTTITGQLTSMSGTIADTAVVTTGRVIHDLAAVAINTQDTLLDLAKLSEGAGSFPSDLGTLVWTMLDETDFVGEIAWAQPAEVYVLSITTRPHGLPLNLTDGVHTIYRCGWWTPLNGTFARQRSYIDFEDNHLTIGGERMPGILVSLQPGGEGHLQAWALT